MSKLSLVLQHRGLTLAHQADIGDEVESLHIHSLHHDGTLGVYSRLNSLLIAVR